MKYELMGHNMSTADNFCEDCGQPKARIVAMGLACPAEKERIEAEDRQEPEEKFEMESDS